jgi:hemolysin III
MEPTEPAPGPTTPDARDPVLVRSASTDRFVRGPRPLTRGWSHLAAAAVALPAALWWIASVPAGQARVGVAAFALGAALMFAASALLHLRRWSPTTCERLVRVDHTGIYLAIGGTGLAVGTLGLQGWPGTLLVTAAVAGTAVGIVAEWLPFAPPRGFTNGVYLTLGWSPVVLVPWLWTHAGPRTVALLFAGGVLYTAGAVIVGLRRPRLHPRVFGYHELFHVLVIAAVALHAWMIADLVTRTG